MSGLTHFDERGQACMVDVGGKQPSARAARAVGVISMNSEAFTAVQNGTARKGDVLGTARLAGIMAAKQTASLIPLCHPLALDTCALDFELAPQTRTVTARCAVKLTAKTGAEMEALTGVSVALLTIYDMCKALDRSMEILHIHLEEKSGGSSGHYIRMENEA